MTLATFYPDRALLSHVRIAELAMRARPSFRPITLPEWARPIPGWGGRNVEIDVGPAPPRFAEPDTLISFECYTSDELEAVVATIDRLISPMELAETLNRAARRYVTLRNDFERYLCRDERRKQLLDLISKYRCLRGVEEVRGAGRRDFAWELAKRETQAEIQLTEIDPFAFVDFLPPNIVRKRQLPEQELIANLLTVFSLTTGQAAARIEIGRVRIPGKFMAFAWACTHRFRNRIGENTIISLANKAKRAL